MCRGHAASPHRRLRTFVILLACLSVACSAYGLAPLVEEEIERETAHMRLRCAFGGCKKSMRAVVLRSAP